MYENENRDNTWKINMKIDRDIEISDKNNKKGVEYIFTFYSDTTTFSTIHIDIFIIF